ncbi:pantoate--beta-alanine ligase [Brevibacillus humidisoli]|uniref:pantoate--beta-alanine ligase n=1 Tax=Brevibacillus humidisoli TaxID=2895522 RepID=UPI001E41D632|nr:pantoate--beta-alanine ligase [Brevibacillus humidisoli]UFJ42746.1 pantoate--beta-alanine ligase [Brevibacillus humidisoli]
MNQVETIVDLRSFVRQARRAGKRIGFVPTMGYLHDGHLKLVEAARQQCDFVVMSIFVNPLQFGPNEDFNRYPRDIERDRKHAEAVGVDLLFTPSVEEMYPHEVLTTVSVAHVSQPLCGRTRPGHFDGVATVVSKLFQIVQPDAAFFGQKDAQQLAVIQQLVKDLSIPVDIVPCPTVREPDGLAMSSRNVYLTEEERSQATVLYRSLQQAEQLLAAGERQAAVIQDQLTRTIAAESLAQIEYVEVMHYPHLKEATELVVGDQILIALAVRFGRTRLIDNLITTVK